MMRRSSAGRASLRLQRTTLDSPDCGTHAWLSDEFKKEGDLNLSAPTVTHHPKGDDGFPPIVVAELGTSELPNLGWPHDSKPTTTDESVDNIMKPD